MRSTIRPSELAAIIGLNSYRGTRLPRSLARIRARCKQMGWPDVTCLVVRKDMRATDSPDDPESRRRMHSTTYNRDWWSIEETEPSKLADDVWHTIRDGPGPFPGFRHLVTTHGEQAAVVGFASYRPGVPHHDRRWLPPSHL